MYKKKIVFIINPASGVATKTNIEKIIDDNIDANKYDYSVEYTKEPGHATEICMIHVENGTDIIVAVGGDGSVNEIARGISGTNVILGIIPAGSGNGLAHHLKIPGQFKQAIDIINKGKVIRMDTGSINDRLFVSIAGIGFDGLVARKFAESRRRGFLTYLRIVTEEYPKYRPRRYTLSFNGKEIKTKALFISFANSDQFGYNTSIAPGAQVDDGLLDITIMKKPMMIELPFLASLLYWRKIDFSKHIEIYKTNELVLKTRRKRWVNIDGEPVKMKKKLHIKVYPQTLNVIVP
jgi:YegS/Rv2252/BmrU family lipid kinase